MADDRRFHDDTERACYYFRRARAAGRPTCRPFPRHCDTPLTRQGFAATPSLLSFSAVRRPLLASQPCRRRRVFLLATLRMAKTSDGFATLADEDSCDAIYCYI